MKLEIIKISLYGVPGANQAQLFALGEGEILEANEPSLVATRIGDKGERIWT
jgi:hypothetical protein